MTKLSNGELQSRLPDGVLISIMPVGRELVARRVDTGEDVTDIIRRHTRYKAKESNCGLRVKHTKTGGIQYRQIPSDIVDKESRMHGTSSKPVAAAAAVVAPTVSPAMVNATSDYSPMSDDDIREFVSRALEFKPDNLIISEINWKYLCRSALRGKNILMVGPSGCGKTLACQSVNAAFAAREYFYFNLGASQDPRGMLIGNTHYDSSQGTFFSEALFVKAIQTPGAIILLDELSRAHDDASNILMTVLDENQRYLRIDEMPKTPTIPVAPGVVFLGTANVGNEYTGARVMDRALLDRFVIIEMDALEKSDELKVLGFKYPTLDEKVSNAIAEIACHTRMQMKSDDPKVSTILSTRMSVEMAGLISDGFSLAEAAEVCVYPFFSPAGGTDSERTYMQQLVQKHLPTDFDDKNRPWGDDEKSDDDDTKVPWA